MVKGRYGEGRYGEGGGAVWWGGTVVVRRGFGGVMVVGKIGVLVGYVFNTPPPHTHTHTHTSLVG